MTMAPALMSRATGRRGALLNDDFRHALGLTPQDLDCAAIVAINALKRGAVKDALSLYRTLVVCDPLVADFQAGLSHCAYLSDAHELSLRAATAVVALEPAKARGYFLSGRACLALGHRPEAEEDLLEAIERGRRERDHSLVRAAEGLLRKIAALKPS